MFSSYQDLYRYIYKHKLTVVDKIRCDNLYNICETINKENIKGDLLEAGTYAGGCGLIMSYANKKLSMNKKIWLMDSFEGIPSSDNTKYGYSNNESHSEGEFSVSLEQVQQTFKELELEDNVKFVPGWFKDTALVIPIKELSLLRFDGDLYSSTLEILENLYNKVSLEGFVIIDDYCLASCKEAVIEFILNRDLDVKLINPYLNNITNPCGIYWRKRD